MLVAVAYYIGTEKKQGMLVVVVVMVVMMMLVMVVVVMAVLYLSVFHLSKKIKLIYLINFRQCIGGCCILYWD